MITKRTIIVTNIGLKCSDLYTRLLFTFSSNRNALSVCRFESIKRCSAETFDRSLIDSLSEGSADIDKGVVSMHPKKCRTETFF